MLLRLLRKVEGLNSSLLAIERVINKQKAKVKVTKYKKRVKKAIV